MSTTFGSKMKRAVATEELLQEPDDETKSKKQRSNEVRDSNNEQNDVIAIEQEPSPIIVISSDDEDVIDDNRSRIGQFSWIYIKSIGYIPFLYRSGMKYIWEATLVLSENGRWINCGDKKVMATDVEVKLLKFVNIVHCKNCFRARGVYYLVLVSHVKEILENIL